MAEDAEPALHGRNIQPSQRQHETKARHLVVSERMAGNDRPVMGRQPDRFCFGDQVTNCEHQAIGADDDSVSHALCAEHRGREGFIRDLRVHLHHRLQRGVQVEAQILLPRLQPLREGPFSRFGHEDIFRGWGTSKTFYARTRRK